jgi:hypothetical protein
MKPIGFTSLLTPFVLTLISFISTPMPYILELIGVALLPVGFETSKVNVEPVSDLPSDF